MNEQTWLQRARDVRWFSRPTTVVVHGDEPEFVDGSINLCYNALDRHVIGGGADELALVASSGADGRPRSYTYAELLERVAQLGGALSALGVGPGDSVLIMLPAVPELMISVLACARIGAVQVVVPAEATTDLLAERIEQTRPVVIISASCRRTAGDPEPLQPRIDAAIGSITHQPAHQVVLNRPMLRVELDPADFDFGMIMRPGTVEPAGCLDTAASAPLFELDGVAGRHGGFTVATRWAATESRGLEPGEQASPDALIGARDWYVDVYAPLLAGAAVLLDEVQSEV